VSRARKRFTPNNCNRSRSQRYFNRRLLEVPCHVKNERDWLSSIYLAMIDRHVAVSKTVPLVDSEAWRRATDWTREFAKNMASRFKGTIRHSRGACIGFRELVSRPICRLIPVSGILRPCIRVPFGGDGVHPGQL